MPKNSEYAEVSLKKGEHISTRMTLEQARLIVEEYECPLVYWYALKNKRRALCIQLAERLFKKGWEWYICCAQLVALLCKEKGTDWEYWTMVNLAQYFMAYAQVEHTPDREGE